MTQNWRLDLNTERNNWHTYMRAFEEDFDGEEAVGSTEHEQEEEEGGDDWCDEDDMGWGDCIERGIEVGDEIEGEQINGLFHSGIVVGIIRDYDGRPVCYKIWSERGNEGFYDYIPGGEVTMHEMSGDAQWSLGRIGYELVEEEDGFTYFKNTKDGDIIVW